MKLIVLFTFLFLNNSFAKDCHLSDSVKLCYLKYQIKYKKNCYKDEVFITKININEGDDIDETNLEYDLKKKKIIGGKNWYNFCFYPVNYYKGICRQKICGEFNIPKFKNKRI